MTLKDLIDVTERFLSNSGIKTDESKWDALYVENLIHRYRGMAIVQVYAQTKNINPLWIQNCPLEYQEDLQESNCMVRFPMPAPMILSNTQTGLIYFGNKNGVCAFRSVKTRAELAMYNGHRFTNRGKYIRGLYIDGGLEVRNDVMLEFPYVDAIFNVPTEVPTFNRQYDNYPIDEASIPLMHQLMYKNEGQFLSLKPVDGNSDSADTANTPNTK